MIRHIFFFFPSWFNHCLDQSGGPTASQQLSSSTQPDGLFALFLIGALKGCSRYSDMGLKRDYTPCRANTGASPELPSRK